MEKGGRVISRKMERLSKNCRVNGYKSLPELNARLKPVRTMYNIAKSTAPEMRRQFLRDLANARAAENNTKASSEIKFILTQEEIRSSFRRIHFARGKKRGVGVSFITYTDEDGQKKETHQREKVELEIMKNNQKKSQRIMPPRRMGGHSPVIWGNWVEGSMYNKFLTVNMFAHPTLINTRLLTSAH